MDPTHRARAPSRAGGPSTTTEPRRGGDAPSPSPSPWPTWTPLDVEPPRYHNSDSSGPQPTAPSPHPTMRSVPAPTASHAPATTATGAKPERPPRPMNAWLLFRNAQVKQLQNENPTERKAQGQLSKIIAELWKAASPETKQKYESLAQEKKLEHARLYPDYRYTPRDKPAKAKANRRRSASAQSASTSDRKVSNDSAPPAPEATSSQHLEVPRRSSMGNMSSPSPSSSSSASTILQGQPSRSPRLGGHGSHPNNYHPYASRGGQRGPSLPPIDTSRGHEGGGDTSRWQPHQHQSTPLRDLPEFSVAGAYPLQNWNPSLERRATDDRRPDQFERYRNHLERDGYRERPSPNGQGDDPMYFTDERPFSVSPSTEGGGAYPTIRPSQEAGTATNQHARNRPRPPPLSQQGFTTHRSHLELGVEHHHHHHLYESGGYAADDSFGSSGTLETHHDWSPHHAQWPSVSPSPTTGSYTFYGTGGATHSAGPLSASSLASSASLDYYHHHHHQQQQQQQQHQEDQSREHRARHFSFPWSGSTTMHVPSPPAESLPTFEYSLYRAPTIVPPPPSSTRSSYPSPSASTTTPDHASQGGGPGSSTLDHYSSSTSSSPYDSAHPVLDRHRQHQGGEAGEEGFHHTAAAAQYTFQEPQYHHSRPVFPHPPRVAPSAEMTGPNEEAARYGGSMMNGASSTTTSTYAPASTQAETATGGGRQDYDREDQHC
ncbi:hypothetical protein JCM3766R1_006969 [Sporobolomyces carnicolor]